MLKHVRDDGPFEWDCTYCDGSNNAPLTHDEALPMGPHVVALPKCDGGAQTLLKLHFTDEERKAHTMIDADGNPRPNHEAAPRPMALATQLKGAGKAFQREQQGIQSQAEPQQGAQSKPATGGTNPLAGLTEG